MAFDVSRIFETSLPSPDGLKAITVRYPTDDEWEGRARRRKVIIRHLGRGQTKSETPNGEEADLALYELIRQEGSAELDAFEASKLIEKLGRADQLDVQKEGNEYTVELLVLGGNTTHRIKNAHGTAEGRFRAQLPDVSFRCRTHATDEPELAGGRGSLRFSFRLERGYEGDVPIPHKVAVVDAVMTAVDMEFEETDETF